MFLPLSDNKELHDMVFNPTEEQAQKSIAYTRPNPNNVKNALPKSTTTTAPKSNVTVGMSKGVSKPTTLAIEQDQKDPFITSKPKITNDYDDHDYNDAPVYMEEKKTQPMVTKPKPSSITSTKPVQQISKPMSTTKPTTTTTSKPTPTTTSATSTASKTVVKKTTGGASSGLRSGAYNY